MRGLLGFSVVRVSFSALCNTEKVTWQNSTQSLWFNQTEMASLLITYLITAYYFKMQNTVSSFPCTAHPKLRDEFCKDAKECFCSRGLAVFSKVRGYLGKFIHCFLLVRVQRLHSWMRVFQEALIPKLRGQYTLILLHQCLCRQICT